MKCAKTLEVGIQVALFMADQDENRGQKTNPQALFSQNLRVLLGIRDSNPDCLIQSQVCCRYTNPQKRGEDSI